MKNETNLTNRAKSDKIDFVILDKCHVTNAFFVMVNGYYEKVAYKDIVWMESFHNYLDIHLKGGQKICVIHPLSKMEEFLPQEMFIRIHRSVIVNIYAVERFRGNMLYIGKRHMDVSRPYRERVFSCFDILKRKRSLEGIKESNSWTESSSE